MSTSTSRLSWTRTLRSCATWAGAGWTAARPSRRTGAGWPRPAEADLGYRLLRRYWRHGYATEGARELVRYGFEVAGLTRVFAQTLAVNAPSRATMAAAGLTFARALISADPDEELKPGAELGEVEYEITRAAWLRSR